MRIDEILRISTQDFPERKVRDLLKHTKDGYGTIDDLTVNYVESGDDRIIVLTNGKEIAAYTGLISRMNGRVWQMKNLQTYGEYIGNQLGAKIIKFIKQNFKKSIQSDIEQSLSAEKLWTKTLPSLGIYPKIFDTETEYIIDKSNPSAYQVAMEKLYTNNEHDPDKFRYTWILEHSDHYSEHSILKENQLLMPYTGIWYTFKD